MFHHCLLVVFALCNAIHAGHHLHQRFHHGEALSRNTSSSVTLGNSSVPGNGTVQEAQDIVMQFQKAMAQANSAIVAKPAANVPETLNGTGVRHRRNKAAFLNYERISTHNRTHHFHVRRVLDNSTSSDDGASMPASSNFTRASYSIPPEVMEAARVMAEANPLPLDDYDALFANLRSQMPPFNDTNIMPQRLQHGSGLVSYVPPRELAVTYQNGTQVAGALETHSSSPDEQDLSVSSRQGQVLKNRDTVAYWQETIEKRGSAPYAPAGYKVWRNVKDYGAYGDGIHDDTAAIQRAVSDGGRCGAGCPSSTVYPATVYFPTGTYLVSSPIIQYYNTEFLGNPLGTPTIKAASSFVGLGVITSDVYTGTTTEWYLNVNNFLRSIRNFYIDIRAAPQDASVCGIHWQVAQGSSLENIWFIATDPSTNPATTQQGIYMENGSGGFMGDLVFVGGKFGAFFGNQQFTASGLLFSGCKTGLQVSWDWGWTMQDMVFQNCGTGIAIVGGAGGPMSDGQGVGSLTLVDVYMENTPLGVETSLYADNSTAFYIQNGGFQNVKDVVKDTHQNVVLYPGSVGGKVNVVSWGFGKVTSPVGETGFLNGADIEAPTVDPSLLTPDGNTPHSRFFHRTRPTYSTIGNSQLIDVKALGAKGDGSTDDTAILNHIFDVAANISAIVYFPYGVYVITDTLQIPVGSRIVGQAWPQIMASGAKFGNMGQPKIAVRVGEVGAVGVVEIQCMLFTVRGATAGAVLMEWNVHESSQGSAGLWDSHFRVGGAAGSHLQTQDCPKGGAVNSNCIAASLMMHITQKASAYLENVWLWVADHDVEAADQTQINVFAARGILIESQGPTWLWGTAAEHATLYQYQLSGAKNLVMGLVQTEAPYYQPTPKAPAPFTKALTFPNDPTFAGCPGDSLNCAVAWALRIIESTDVYVLSTGIYTWFSSYSQACVDSGLNNCQQSSFYVEQSFDVWIYNLVTVGSLQMISPLNGVPVLAKNNRNGYASSIVAWLGGANQTTGGRVFPGYQLYARENLTNTDFSDICKTALTATITCDNTTREWTSPSYHGSLGNATPQTQVCDASCGTSLSSWYHGVSSSCAGFAWPGAVVPPLNMTGGYIWYGFNETCQQDTQTGLFCSDTIANFTLSASLESMPTADLCSPCYLDRLKMMQKSAYSIFNVFTWYQRALQTAVAKCSLANVPTNPQPPLISGPAVEPFCVSAQYYETVAGDTCNRIATAKNVSSASLFQSAQPYLTNCTSLPAGLKLCMPPSCPTYLLRSDDTCVSASARAGVQDITLFNPWINSGCDNLHSANITLGGVVCAGPSGGAYQPGLATNTSSFPGSGEASSHYSTTVMPPPGGHQVAPGTDPSWCGQWHVATSGDQCATLTVTYSIGLDLLTRLNPSIDGEECTGSLVTGNAYCVSPVSAVGLSSSPYEDIPHRSFGCWYNADPSSDVLTESSYTNTTNMSVEICASKCLGDDTAFFALKGSNQCMCGSKITINSAQVASSKCDVACVGDSMQTCGGADGPTSLWAVSNRTSLSYEYADLGCYADSTSLRALIGGISRPALTNNTVAVCSDLCLPTYPYFGVENGSDCWCGTGPNTAAETLSGSHCDTNCTGRADEKCGGASALEVFAVKTPFSLPASTTSTSRKSSTSGTSSTSSISISTSSHLPASTTSSSTRTSSSTSSSASPSPSGPWYWGCYTEPPNVRALGGASYVDYNIMTVDICQQFCVTQSGYEVFGIEYSGECWCGHAISTGSTSVPESDCNMKCPGNAAQMCGAGNRLNVYGMEPASSPPPSVSTALPASAAYTSLGCYTEATNSRALSSASKADFTSMTVDMCGTYCLTDLGHTLFGVEYGGECYCGDEFQPGSVAAPASDCNMACPGNASQTCGAGNRLNVYQRDTA